ncbi:MAG: LacI family transcriptional regulator [Cyclobacteriaceae bacterium]|nr:LacI family transcriptional regulator [Cyclobacteriaceae bacterium]MDW8332350.1 LacI family DNA-binding transcriptional regulator [Cyclobacteriaceae bacterium]
MRFNQVTIKDIARELGISPSTVSRALKNHPDISSETKKAVHELAEKLNYQPNIVALSLRHSKTNTIGVVIPEIVHYFFSTVISGIESVAYEAGYNVILTQSNESAQREATDLKALFNSRVDGMLISISRETKQYDHIESILSKDVPVVFFDRSYDNPNTSKVLVDDYEGAREAVKHLISQGCKRIAHLEMAPGLAIAEDRKRGYVDALKEHNLSVHENLTIICPSGSLEDGQRAAEQLLSLKNPPDGIFANNDLLAFGAMQVIKKRGLKIPKDIAIVGYSNWFFSALMDPPLSSVHQPGFEMGQEAARLLISHIEMKEKGEGEIVPEKKILKTHLVIRESSLKKG